MLVISSYCTDLLRKSSKITILGPMNISKQQNHKIKESELVIIVDGGANHGLKGKKSILIGDADSIEDQNVKFDCLLPVDKDYSDFYYALKLIEECKPLNDELLISCFGFYGGRLDHQMAVINDSLNSPIEKINLHTPDSELIKCHKSIEFNHQGSFSLICAKEQRISIRGEAKYQLNEDIISPSSLTLSNQAYGNVEVKTTSKLFVSLNSN